jgi:hypothetical protein
MCAGRRVKGTAPMRGSEPSKTRLQTQQCICCVLLGARQAGQTMSMAASLRECAERSERRLAPL